MAYALAAALLRTSHGGRERGPTRLVLPTRACLTEHLSGAVGRKTEPVRSCQNQYVTTLVPARVCDSSLPY
jgi:hypothetical protein